MPRARYVVRDRGAWAVRASAHGKSISSFKTQQEAIDTAREQLETSGGQLHVYTSSGQPRPPQKVARRPHPLPGDAPRPAGRKERRARLATQLGIAAAVLTFVGIVVSVVGPGWWADVTTPPTENRLSELHAGGNLSSIEDAIGAATSTEHIGGSDSLKRTVYVRDRFAVAAVSDAGDQIIVLAVLNCGPALDAVYRTPIGSTVRLGDAPLAEVESIDSESDVNNRMLYYAETMSGKVTATFLELTTYAPASGTGWLAHAVGFSNLCGTEPPADLFTIDRAGYSGIASDAPAEIRAFREAQSANLYLEFDQNDTTLQINEYAVGTLYIDGVATEGVALGLFAEDLPGEFPRKS